MKTFEEWFTVTQAELDHYDQAYLEERKIAMHMAWSAAVIMTRRAIEDKTFDLVEALQ